MKTTNRYCIDSANQEPGVVLLILLVHPDNLRSCPSSCSEIIFQLMAIMVLKS